MSFENGMRAAIGRSFRDDGDFIHLYLSRKKDALQQVSFG